ncbi:hypothetical protein V1294_002325 [Bradyrhizobium sp. AZCC 1678]
MQTSGDQRREKAKLYPPSLPATNAKRLRKGAKRRSNPCLRLPCHGLLRCARNDVEGTVLAP